MAVICNLTPKTSRGEDSKLYLELVSYTGHNRRLSNFLYATALLNSFRKKCSPKDFNSLGEPSSEKVIKELRVAELLDTEVLVTRAQLELQAHDGLEYIEYPTVEEILPKVMEFNNREGNILRASIKELNGQYIINIAPLDDTNYLVNTGYNAGLEQLQETYNELERLGLNTVDWSRQSKKALNALNARYFPDFMGKMRSFTTGNINNLSIDLVSLLLDMFKDNTIIQRFQTKFGDRTASVLLYMLSTDPELSPELEDIRELIEASSTKDLFNAFRKTIEITFKKAKAKELKDKAAELYKESLSEEDAAIKATLLNLYDRYHLDKDNINITLENINSVEDMTNVILSRMHNTVEVLLKRGILSPDATGAFNEKIQELEDEIAKKEYTKSILDFLRDVANSLNDISNILLQEDASLEHCNEIASLLLYIKELLDAYHPVVQLLMDAKALVNDLDANDITEIQKLATSLNTQLTNLNTDFRKKQFDLTYAYLKLFWGEDKHYKGMGSFDVALKDALTLGHIDMNIFERWLSAATEVTDPVLSTLAESIKDMHTIRDNRMRDIDYKIRVMNDNLFSSGSDSSFMFETDAKGNVHIISEIDWDKFYEARAAEKDACKEKGFSSKALKTHMEKWDALNLGDYLIDWLHDDLNQAVVLHNVPNKKYRKSMPSLSPAQMAYYKEMLQLKYDLEASLESYGCKTFLFRPVQIPKEGLEILLDATPAEVVSMMRERFTEWKLPNSSYGVLEKTLNANGEEVNALPIFYIDKLEDQSHLSKDFSKSMLAFASMTTNHNVLSDRVSVLEVVKDFLMERPIEATLGGHPVVQTVEALGVRMSTPARTPSSKTMIGGWINDLYEAKVYGKRHKLAGNLGPISGETLEKATTLATQYTSTTGLVMNLPGAIANVMVGKLLMVIEGLANEFLNYKDLAVAEAKYWEMLPPLLGEVYSNNKSSKLGLLLDRFDAMDEFYDRLKESGFYKSPLSKILGNTSLFFMYGLGEHLLHALTMLACLNHVKIKRADDPSTKGTHTLLDAFSVEKKGNNGKLVLSEGWVYYNKIDKQWHPVNEEFIERLKKVIAYTNRSMNGAFGADEKGAIHRYAVGRLVMNFRQWMPAHYARRFNKLHFDADLGDYREGYYVTLWKFGALLVTDAKDKRFQIRTRWHLLTPMERANMKRVLAEQTLLALFIVLSRCNYGGDPKHRTWGEAMINYQIKRCRLEISASDPFHPGCINNILTILNSPAASLNTLKNLAPLLNLDELITGEKYESGKYAGEYKYVHRLERAVPFYNQVNHWINMDIDDSIFATFKNN